MTKNARQTSVVANLGVLDAAVAARMEALEEDRFSTRFYSKDPSLWSNDPLVMQKVQNRLGWIDLDSRIRESVSGWMEYAQSKLKTGTRNVVLLGMGGSSLCPYVFRKTLFQHSSDLDFSVLDLTNPCSIKAIDDSSKGPVLFLVSSKSGTTIETSSFYRYFAQKYSSEHFVAITDPGSSLEKLALESGFDNVFYGLSDVGGRYAALSAFGLVPAALMGLDVNLLLDRASAIHGQAREGESSTGVDSGIWLGAVMAEAARAGRDKITFLMSSKIDSLGLWIEQLVAESTGKSGKGIVPVVGEPIGSRSTYSDDRIFVYLRLPGDAGSTMDKRVDELAEAGFPLVRFHLGDAYDLGAEMLRWEIATAVAGSIMAVNPFDEPNVTDAKSRTNKILSAYEKERSLPDSTPSVVDGDISIFADDALVVRGENKTSESWLSAHFRRLGYGDYSAVLAYLPDDPAIVCRLSDIQEAIRDATSFPATVGFGPRYLHSTGQLHKGGANNGLFIMITTDVEMDFVIPSVSYGFKTLERAQALGDEEALRDGGRRVVRCHLGGADIEKGLALLGEKIRKALTELRWFAVQ